MYVTVEVYGLAACITHLQLVLFIFFYFILELVKHSVHLCVCLCACVCVTGDLPWGSPQQTLTKVIVGEDTHPDLTLGVTGGLDDGDTQRV